jgi:hypothetical protein
VARSAWVAVAVAPLMSGRGAADALAKMTSVAGGFFIVTSLGTDADFRRRQHQQWPLGYGYAAELAIGARDNRSGHD